MNPSNINVNQLKLEQAPLQDDMLFLVRGKIGGLDAASQRLVSVGSIIGGGFIPSIRKVNGKSLVTDIVLNSNDIGAEPNLGLPASNGMVLSSSHTGIRSWIAITATQVILSVFGRSGAIIAQSGDYLFSQIGSTPTTIAGYGILDAFSGVYSDLSGLPTLGTASSHSALDFDPAGAAAAITLVGLGGEPALGNPPVDGAYLSSTALGVRSWVVEADTSFIHTQAVASLLWIVNHNLGITVSTSVFDLSGNEVEAEVSNPSLNQTRISFSTPTAGKAKFQ